MKAEWLDRIQAEHQASLGCPATTQGAEHVMIASEIYRTINTRFPDVAPGLMQSAMWLAMQMVCTPEGAALAVRQAAILPSK